MTFDSKDRTILDLLQANARISASDIAQEIGMSVPAVTERIRKLVDQGLIKGFHAHLSSKELAYDVTAFLTVVMSSAAHYDDFIQHSQQTPEILECHSITGEGSHIIKIRTRNTSSLETLLRTIQTWPGVQRTHTMVVMSTYKETFNIPLDTPASDNPSA